jgi:hypothetical protein
MRTGVKCKFLKTGECATFLCKIVGEKRKEAEVGGGVEGLAARGHHEDGMVVNLHTQQ